MKPEINIEPLRKYLTESITPKQLSKLLDELAFDYLKMIIRLHSFQEEELIDIHEEANSYIFHLKELRDVLRKCKV